MLDDILKLSRNFLKTFNKPYRRYFLQKYPLASRFSIITGQRGVGKTTAIIQKTLSANDDDIFGKNALTFPSIILLWPAEAFMKLLKSFITLAVK